MEIKHKLGIKEKYKTSTKGSKLNFTKDFSKINKLIYYIYSLN